jgi:hypothetical protein
MFPILFPTRILRIWDSFISIQEYGSRVHELVPIAQQPWHNSRHTTPAGHMIIETNFSDSPLLCGLCKHVCKDAVLLDNGVASVLPCLHRFCQGCIEPVVRQDFACPQCGLFCALSSIQPDIRARQLLVETSWYCGY